MIFIKDQKDVNLVLEYCKKTSILGLDIETCRKYKKNLYDESVYSPGLDVFTSKICMIQIGDENEQFVIDARKVDCSFLKEVLENESILKIGHNLKFDGKHILHNYNISLKNVWDTMIVEKILYNGMPWSFSLEATCKRYFNVKSTEDKNDLFEEEDELEIYENLLNFIDFKETIFIDKSIRTNFVNIGDRDFTKEEIEYGVNDILYVLKIYKEQIKGRKIGNEVYFPKIGIDLENKFTQILAKIENRGINLNVKGWNTLYEHNLEIYQQKKKKLDDFVINNFPQFSRQYDLFTSERTCGVDWKSPKEVIKFAKFLKCCPKEKSKQTGRMEDSVGAKAIFKLLSNENKTKFLEGQDLDFKDVVQGFIFNYLSLKKYQQLTTTFGKEWLRFVHPITGKVYTNFMQLMNTGRMSSVSPNCQQIPSPKIWRELFISEKENSLVSTDFSAQEARIAADLTDVKEMQQIFNEGHPIFKDDMHSMTATNMFRIIKNNPEWICDKKEHKKERTIAKNMLFKLLFGGSDFTVAQDLGVEIEEGRKFYNAFFDGNPGMRENFEITKQKAIQNGWVELDAYTEKRWFFKDFEKMNSLYQQAWKCYPEGYSKMSKEERQKVKESLKTSHPHLSSLWKEYMVLKGKLERAALNYRIQGLASSMTKLSAILIEEYNELNNIPLKYGILLLVHDEIVEEYPEEISEERSKLTIEFMKKSGQYFCKKVGMDAETAVGKYWIH